MSEEFSFNTVAQSNPHGGVDVIFIHGLSGDPLATWTSKESKEKDGEYWPKWLFGDIPALNVYTLGYPSSIFAKWARKEMTLFERAQATLEYLAGYEFGSRPIVLITHSLGGLLAKQIIRTGADSDDAGWKAIAESCQYVIFLATPHTGSSLASALDLVIPNFKSESVDLLVSMNGQLDELNKAYRILAPKLHITTTAYYEKFKTKNATIIVEQPDADPGVAGTNPIPVDADHISICKPANRNSPVYVSVRKRVGDFAKMVQAKPQAPAPSIPQAGHPVALLDAFKDQWLKDKAAGTTGSPAKGRATRRDAIVGTWTGRQAQPLGPAGQPIDYIVSLSIARDGDQTKGTFHFVYSNDGVVLVDESLPFEGEFTYERFLLLNYSDQVTGKLQFGCLLLELGDDGKTLSGVDVGFGYTTKQISTAKCLLTKEGAH